MKALFVVITICLTLTTSAQTEKQLWQQYKQQYNKSYSNLIEDQFRFKLYQKNLHDIEEHNLKFEKGAVSWKKGINKFTDWTAEELNRILTHKAGKLYLGGKTSNHKSQVRSDVPDSIDWREKGVVLGVKDQGKCSSCGAFSATGLLEAHIAIKYGKKVPLSEQYLMDCGSIYFTNGCNGGDAQNFIMYARDFSIVSEEDYPYKGINLACNGTNNNKINLTLGDIHMLPQTQEDLKVAVATVGPIAVVMNAVNLFTYHGGIYQNPSCNKHNLNHAVLVVGYGTENGLDYWIVKNSWGETFGEDGFFRIIRNTDNDCGLSIMALYVNIL